MKKDTFQEGEVRRVMKAMPGIMEKYDRVLARDVGERLCIIKFHLILHALEDIFRFGALRNTNSDVGENNHKFNTKADAVRTQRIAALLDSQTAARSVSRMALRMGAEEVARLSVGWEKVGTQMDEGKKYNRMGSRLKINWTRSEDGKVTVSLQPLKNKRQTLEAMMGNWGDTFDLEKMKDMFVALLEDVTKDEENMQCEITTFTEYTMETSGGGSVLFRANPYWKKTGWHDWCLAEDERTTSGLPTAAHHLMIFYEITGITNASSSRLASDGDGWYAWTNRTIRKDLFGDRKKKIKTNYYGSMYSSFLDDNATFVVWDAKETVGSRNNARTVAGVSDTHVTYNTLPLYMLGEPLMGVCDPESSCPHTYVFVEKRSTWEDHFVQYADYVVQREREDRREDAGNLSDGDGDDSDLVGHDGDELGGGRREGESDENGEEEEMDEEEVEEEKQIDATNYRATKRNKFTVN
jgi:hypothetical protein